MRGFRYRYPLCKSWWDAVVRLVVVVVLRVCVLAVTTRRVAGTGTLNRSEVMRSLILPNVSRIFSRRSLGSDGSRLSG